MSWPCHAIVHWHEPGDLEAVVVRVETVVVVLLFSSLMVMTVRNKPRVRIASRRNLFDHVQR